MFLHLLYYLVAIQLHRLVFNTIQVVCRFIDVNNTLKVQLLCNILSTQAHILVRPVPPRIVLLLRVTCRLARCQALFVGRQHTALTEHRLTVEFAALRYIYSSPMSIGLYILSRIALTSDVIFSNFSFLSSSIKFFCLSVSSFFRPVVPSDQIVIM